MTPLSNRAAAQIRTATTSATPMLGMPQWGDLPVWESFPLADRRLLVSALVQTARRQIQNQSPNRPMPGQR
jgi:hypothetical protein